MTDGGREVGDVELALFKKAASASDALPGDPLSPLPARDAYAPPDAPAPASRPFPTSATTVQPAQTSSQHENSSSQRPSPAKPLIPIPEALASLKSGAAVGLVPESSWRDAMVKACADLLGKSLDELATEFEEAGGRGSGPHAPRDLADFAIMTTLRTRDAFAMQNAPSWLFNTMDRSGAGYVLRDEFVRYSPFMSPVADAAVAAIVFDELLRAQVNAQAKRDAEAAAKAAKGGPPPRPQRFQRTRERTSSIAAGAVSTARQCSETLLQTSTLRRRQGAGGRMRVGGSTTSGTSEGADGDVPESEVVGGGDSVPGDESSGEMYPISEALRFTTWKQYFDAIQKKYHYRDEDWPRVRAELGLDPSERLIKAQGALDHSLALPTLGKLYVTQRYVIFFAAVGRNHYVARLGAISNIGVRSFPILMRDCLTIKLESETHSAMSGISANAGTTRASSQKSLNGASRVDAGRAVTRDAKRANTSPRPAIVTEADIRQLRRNSLPRPPGPASASRVPPVDSVSTDKDVQSMPALPASELGVPLTSHVDEDRNVGVAGCDNTPEVPDTTGDHSDHMDFDTEECSGTRRGGRNEADKRTMPQHIAEVMQQFTAGGKLLVFSLIEIRDTSRRDLWISVIQELVAAHRLHLQLGFGSSGRVVPDMYADSEDPSDCQAWTTTEGSLIGTSSYMAYLSSPFRNEPPPPLLAVAAHANVVRYRAIRVIDGARVPKPLLVFSHAERCKAAVSWYVDSVREHDNRGGRSWIERAMDAIRENMELNKRVYVVKDDEPFDVARLGEGIGRLAELCTPVVRVLQFATHIIQWQNPPATILALATCLSIVYYRLVVYLPGVVVFAVAGAIVATRTRAFGMDSWLWGGGRPEDAKERQANVLQLVSQVHDTLRAGQNVIKRINMGLGKVQTLCLWGSGDEWQSWVVVCVLGVVGVLLMCADARVLFTIVVWILFSKHFLPPNNIPTQFWALVPERVVAPEEATALVRN